MQSGSIARGRIGGRGALNKMPDAEQEKYRTFLALLKQSFALEWAKNLSYHI